MADLSNMFGSRPRYSEVHGELTPPSGTEYIECGRCFPFNASPLRAIGYRRNATKVTPQ
jgi:hypothetical protein